MPLIAARGPSKPLGRYLRATPNVLTNFTMISVLIDSRPSPGVKHPARRRFTFSGSSFATFALTRSPRPGHTAAARSAIIAGLGLAVIGHRRGTGQPR